MVDLKQYHKNCHVDKSNCLTDPEDVKRQLDILGEIYMRNLKDISEGLAAKKKHNNKSA